MSFEERILRNQNIKRVLHVGADRGGELPQYEAMGVKEVVWVEANPEVFEELKAYMKETGSYSVTQRAFNRLIADKDDEIKEFHLYYGPDAGYRVGNKGMSSLLKAEPTWWGARCHRGTIQLQALTLDTFVERSELGHNFDLLNIDTQGAELMVLSGAAKVLACTKFINIEVTVQNPQYQGNPLLEDINRVLDAHGFDLVQVNMATADWGDAIYAKR